MAHSTYDKSLQTVGQQSVSVARIGQPIFGNNVLHPHRAYRLI
ncbi:MAG: hypothetical protein VX709_00575 [Pseudomonadota bacterium]|nr:hypothetical protein [Pseudomonadota bacterium]